MNLVFASTSAEQRIAAQEAAIKRYKAGRWKDDRPGWLGGKCPVSEYRAILGEIAVANHVGYDWTRLCLYSPNPKDYRTPDIGGLIEVKSGSTFNDHDKAKGAEIIVFVTPVEKDASAFNCNIPECSNGLHRKMTGDVEIRGWFSVTEDWDKRSDFGGYYKPAGETFRSPETLPFYAWAEDKEEN